MARKDYIGPTISSKKKSVVLPEGPIAEQSNKPSQGMRAARNLLGKEAPKKVDGTPVRAPLPLANQVLPGVKKSPVGSPHPPGYEGKKSNEPGVDPTVVVGNSHIDSYQTILKNDRMEKPRIKAWQDDDSSTDKET